MNVIGTVGLEPSVSALTESYPLDEAIFNTQPVQSSCRSISDCHSFTQRRSANRRLKLVADARIELASLGYEPSIVPDYLSAI